MSTYAIHAFEGAELQVGVCRLELFANAFHDLLDADLAGLKMEDVVATRSKACFSRDDNSGGIFQVIQQVSLNALRILWFKSQPGIFKQ
jgi:hypothetical protein